MKVYIVYEWHSNDMKIFSTKNKAKKYINKVKDDLDLFWIETHDIDEE